MAEAVRLVRCPKCENLLPELLDLSLYKCGGCDAVLRAKANGNPEDGLSEVSDEVKGSGQPEECNIVRFPRIGGVERNLVDMENADGFKNGGVERNCSEGMTSNVSMSQPKRMDTLTAYDKVKRGKERMRRKQTFDDEYEPYSHGPVHNRNRGKICDLNGDNIRESQAPREMLRSRPIMDEWGVKSNARGVPTRAGFDGFPYRDQGQSSYDMNSNHKQGEWTQYLDHGLDEVARIESLENGRAELLRKLDELKDQITRSCDVADKPKERLGIDPMTLSSSLPDPYGRCNASYGSQVPSKQLLGSNGVPQYGNRAMRFVPYTERCSLGVPDSYPQNGWGYPHDFLHRPNAEMNQKPTHMQESHLGQRPYHDYCHGYLGDANPELFMLHQHENFFHQPACSCMHCREKTWHPPPNVDIFPGLHNRRSQQGPSNPSFHQIQNSVQQGNNCGGSILHPIHSQQTQLQHSKDMDSDNEGFDFHRPRKLGLHHRRGRASYPIAGGAPFMTCGNCFELLKLSRKHVSLAKNQQKMKCGACSSVLLFELSNKGFIASVSGHVDQVPPEIDEGSNGAAANSLSNNFDDSQQKFESSVSGGSRQQLGPLSSTSSLYNGMDSPENVPCIKHGPENVPSIKHGSQFAELPDVPTEECPDRFSLDNGLDAQCDDMIKSKRWEDERASFDVTNSEENPVEASGVATEISMNGLSNSYVSQNSVDTNKDHSKGNKGGESFLAALIKKGFRDLQKSSRGGEVFVNGHLIPDRAVKKAEKLAGPIQPGDYWYDKKAGFWGVMGYSCLGIVMPNIEEFNYPMPKNCAAGNTGVYINGRELNQRDLQLLVKRGLPTMGNRSYLLEITGEVLDEDTGEQLDSLGKLAPTVLRAKHGFGMKVHRFLTQPKS